MGVKKVYRSWRERVEAMDANRDRLLANDNMSRLGRVVGWIQSAPDVQLANPNNSSLSQVVGIQGPNHVQLINTNVNVAGGDINNHTTHVHVHHGANVDVTAILYDMDNFRKIQQETLDKATAGTIEWLFKSQYFSMWWDKTGGFKVLWGSGMPGAGKTILTSIAINKIERRAAESPDPICIAYFYMRYSEHAKLTIRSVLEALVKQSVERHEELLPLFKAAYTRHMHERTQPTDDELLELLQEFTARISGTFYFLDALDEAPIDIQHDLIEKLASLNAQIFITSRPMKELQPFVPESHCFEIVAQEQDLDLHIAKKLNSPRLQTLLAQRDASFRGRVITAIKSKCGGMFLHASLQLDALRQCPNIHSILQTLECFPIKVEDVYHQTWKRVLNQGPEQAALATAALVWVLHAKRSLTIKELCHATATHPVTHKFEEDRLIPPSTIIDICHGLLAMDEESQLVRLVHYTAKQPMEQLLINTSPPPHSLLATICTTHLTSCGLQDISIASTEKLEGVLKSDPLLRYAYDFWPFHAHESLEVHLTIKSLSTFISGCRAFPVQVPSHKLEKLSLDFLGPLHIVAFYNLPIQLAGLFDGDSTNAKTKTWSSTPLLLASVRGHYGAVENFLDLPDVLVNASNDDGCTALMYAIWRGCENTVKLLLAHPGITIVPTVLTLASKHGREKIIKLLLAHPGAEAYLTDGTGSAALIVASRWGRQDTVKALLTFLGIKVNLSDKDGDTALMLASKHGFHRVVELLLINPGIEVNLANNNGDTALMLACMYSFVWVAKLLLSHPGIKVNQANAYGFTALMQAPPDFTSNVSIYHLPQHTTKINFADEDGDTASVLAMPDGRGNVIRLLLAHPDTDVNLTNRDGDTALMLAFRIRARGGIGIVKFLLTHPDTNVNLANKDGQTALTLASQEGHKDIFELLLAHRGIEVDLLGNSGLTASADASPGVYTAIAKLFDRLRGSSSAV